MAVEQEGSEETVLAELFTPHWIDAPTESTVEVQMVNHGETTHKTVVYDRRQFFPVTRWLREHEGKRLTDEDEQELHELLMEIDYRRDDPDGCKDRLEKSRFRQALHNPVQDAVRWVCMMNGELTPLIVQRLCRLLVGGTQRLEFGVYSMGAKDLNEWRDRTSGRYRGEETDE